MHFGCGEHLLPLICANRNKLDSRLVSETAWREADAYLVGRYVLMPDHIHLFCAPNRYPETELKRWIRYWKSLVARRFPFELQGKLWQREFWDRQLRSGDSYSEKWAYVDANPVRAGLASETRQWPYAGEMVQLAWHD